MKRTVLMVAALLATLAFIIVFPVLAMAEAEGGVGTDGAYSWEYLGTIAGATAATLLIVQYLKVPFDRVWKIPTRALVYVIAFLVLLAGVGFTTGVSLQSLPLVAINAFVVALAAMGSYELTFAKVEKPPDTGA